MDIDQQISTRESQFHSLSRSFGSSLETEGLQRINWALSSNHQMPISRIADYRGSLGRIQDSHLPSYRSRAASFQSGIVENANWWIWVRSFL